MKTSYRFVFVSLCVLALLGLGQAACDGTRPDAPQAAERPGPALEGQQARPLARYDAGTLTLAVSLEEAREVVTETAHRLVPKIEEVTFEEPELEMVDGRPYLMMRGARPDGNCALAFVRLASESALAEGDARFVSERLTPQDQGAVLYKTIGGSCNGDPCRGCRLYTSGGDEICDCVRGGPDGTAGWCNHSTGGG